MIVEWKEKADTGGVSDKEKKAEICSSMMLVRILEIFRGEPSGEIIHLNLQKPVSYEGLAEMIFRIDQIARFLGVGENGTHKVLYRSLKQDSGKVADGLPEEYSKVVSTGQRAREGFCRGLHLKKAQEVVCVEILGRQYMSLQGRLRCGKTGEKYIYFRSALELMYLFSDLSQEA